MASLETRKKLAAIRRISAAFPDATAEERLLQIEGIASGKLEPKLVRREHSANLAERLAAGQASRSPRSPAIQAAKQKAQEAREAARKDEEKKAAKKRKGKPSKDRMETSNLNRSADLND